MNRNTAIATFLAACFVGAFGVTWGLTELSSGDDTFAVSTDPNATGLRLQADAVLSAEAAGDWTGLQQLTGCTLSTTDLATVTSMAASIEATAKATSIVDVHVDGKLGTTTTGAGRIDSWVYAGQWLTADPTCAQ